MITWVKKNWMRLIKIAAVVLYFLFLVREMVVSGIFPVFESRSYSMSFIRGLMMNGIMLYLFTWLYKWVVKGNLRGWHMQSILIVVCGLAIRLLMDSLYLLVHPMETEESMQTILYYAYLIWAFLLVIMLLCFFVFDRRKICICKTRVPKGISIALLVSLAYITASVIVTIQVNTPMEPLGLDNLANLINAFISRPYQYVLSDLVNQLAVVWGLVLFFLLWLNTKPASEKIPLESLD
ncbi:MAG: hypothetical protein VB081_12765 [Christensenella sp.]|uniref:hypothetical protein n=1 Tax=Christensenella sp. TaxID=1935934 RepID=UPI002B20998B|nr:hypothetical protein [Christensenella sp.]MEA5004350.1 hypothetical protein [Christensenella sp.]